jgi:hypothetical protein
MNLDNIQTFVPLKFAGRPDMTKDARYNDRYKFIIEGFQGNEPGKKNG